MERWNTKPLDFPAIEIDLTFGDSPRPIIKMVSYLTINSRLSFSAESIQIPSITKMIKCGRPPKGNEQLSQERLLDAALQLFLEHGYGDLSMETLARDARVSLRTIYNQFGGKSGVFGALIRRCSDQFSGVLKQDEPLEEALEEFGRQFLFRITRPDVIRLRAILVGESPRFPDLAIQFYEHGPRRTLAQLSEFFAYHQAANRIIPIDPKILADHYISTLRGEHIQRLQLGLESIPTDQEIAQWVHQATQLFLRGCMW